MMENPVKEQVCDIKDMTLSFYNFQLPCHLWTIVIFRRPVNHPLTITIDVVELP